MGELTAQVGRTLIYVHETPSRCTLGLPAYLLANQTRCFKSLCALPRLLLVSATPGMHVTRAKLQNPPPQSQTPRESTRHFVHAGIICGAVPSFCVSGGLESVWKPPGPQFFT